ncbi:hypothetical protein [Longimicrobium sp.]|uniref:hypothetical protein n=1 Tax=Longimicrobium sp. TaxID=2029185 RepID=UPI002C8DDD06|nr:hypothetical protein [Longimicrobium sp.]HSU14066.1 hypothetical protein [Longimicrobium sp.]
MRLHAVLTLAAALAMATARPAAAQRGCSAPQGTVLAISAEPIQIASGGTAAVGVVWYAGGYTPPLPVPSRCRVAWSVQPAAAGRVDARGRLTVPAAARPGSRFTLVARVGHDTARQTVNVVDARPNPLAANWSQADSARCTGGEGGPAPEPIRELILRRDSAFSLTAVPFESYRDYWGRYSYDAATGALHLRIEGGNHSPADGDLEGIARVEGGRLTMEGFWLGDPRQERGGRTCTYVFTRGR